MINAYNEIISFEGDNFQDYLDKIFLYSVFEDLFTEYPDLEVVKGIIKFIAYGYSMDSEMLMMNGNTWTTTAPKIFAKCKLDDEYKEDTVLLKNTAVRKSIDKFLNLQNDENWKQFITYRDLRAQMLTSAIGVIVKSTGEIDYEQKMKNSIHSQTLLQMMNDAMETFIQNNPKLKSSVEAFNRVNEKAKVTRNVGSYAL